MKCPIQDNRTALLPYTWSGRIDRIRDWRLSFEAMRKNRRFFTKGLALAVLVAAGGIYLYLRNEQGEPAPKLGAADGAASPGAADQASMLEQGFEAMFNALRSAGAKDVPPIADTLKEAVESGDPSTIAQAFNEAVYDRFAKMEETIPILRDYLVHPSPAVRFLAAEKLYIVGDTSGADVLIELMKAKSPVMDSGRDLRIAAAHMAAKFRDRSTVPAMVQLWKETGDATVLNAITRTARTNTPQEILESLHAPPTQAFGLINLTFASDPSVITAAKNAFIDPQTVEIYRAQTVNIAAWAMMQAGERGQYFDHLLEQSRLAVSGQKPSGNTNQFKDALKYLASVQDPNVKEFLETALSSNDDDILKIATVNLLFNQGGSQKAKDVVLAELRGEHYRLGIDLAYSIAAALRDDPVIRAAGAESDRRTEERRWNSYAVKRANWPIYNWIDDYVVILNESNKDK